MKLKMSKPKYILFLIALFLSNIIIIGDYVISPTYNTLYTIFADKMGMVNFIVSGYYIVVIFVSLLAGKLCARFSKKTLMITGAVFASIGGIGISFIQQPLFMCIMRACTGVGYAFTQVCAIALISELYEDEALRGKMIGYYNAAMTAIGTILGIAAGKLATISLSTVYSLNWVIVLYLILLVLFVPSIKPEKTAFYDEETTKKGEKLGGKYWLSMLNFQIFGLSFSVLLFFVSIYVAENGLGDEVVTGTANTINTITGFAASLMYAYVCKALGKNMFRSMYFITGLALLFLKLIPCVSTLFIAIGVAGAAYLLANIHILSSCSTLVPLSRVDDAIGVFTAVQMGVTCIVSYFVTFGMNIIHTESFTDFLIVPIALCAISGVADMFITKSDKKFNNANPA